MQLFQCDLQPQIQETHRTMRKGTTTRCRTQRRNQTTAAATAAHRRYLSSPAEATLHGKPRGFVLRLPPQTLGHPGRKVSHQSLTPPFIECILM